jgi:hypothetical protein
MAADEESQDGEQHDRGCDGQRHDPTKPVEQK